MTYQEALPIRHVYRTTEYSVSASERSGVEAGEPRPYALLLVYILIIHSAVVPYKQYYFDFPRGPV
jgi:hypothetical protein